MSDVAGLPGSRKLNALLALLALVTVLPSLFAWRMASLYARIAREERRVMSVPRDHMVVFSPPGELVSIRSADRGWSAVASCHDGGFVAATRDAVSVLDREQNELRRFRIATGHEVACGDRGRVAVATNAELFLLDLEPATPDLRIRFGEGHVAGVAWVGDGIFVSIGGRDELLRLTPDGEVQEARRLRGMAGPLRTSSDGRLYMSDELSGRVWLLGRDGDDRLITSNRRESIADGQQLLAADDQTLYLGSVAER